jgi:prophage antirepressor-like protein
MSKENGTRIELWNGRVIRFVERSGEWWAVANDVAEALGYERPKDAVSAHCKGAVKQRLLTNGGRQQMYVIPEKDIYRLIFHSRLPEAEAFQDWVFDIIKEIREDALGLKSYEAFRLMDKEQQKAAMSKLFDSLREPVKVDYIKANLIADKAVSTMHGYPKLVKKPDMAEAMLRDREPILADTVELMALNERFGLGLSVSEHIYQKHAGARRERGAA